MALLFMDGFDHYYIANPDYPGVLPGKWSANGSSPYDFVAGRHGGYAYQSRQAADSVYSYMYKDLSANYETIIAGFAFYWASGYSPCGASFFKLMDSSTVHLYLQIAANYKIAVYKGDGTLLGSGEATLAPATWYYFEIKAKIANSSGECIVRANEIEQINFSGDTQNGGNAYVNRVRIAGTNLDTPTYIDDFVVLDTIGPAPFNDFLGFVRIDTIRPTAAGATTEWNASTGSPYQCVDETQDNRGSDYIVTSGEKKAVFTMANVPVDMTGSIFAIATNVIARNYGTAVTSVVPVLEISGQTYSGEVFDPSETAMTNYQTIKTTSPATGVAWTSGELNALEAGVLRKY